MTPDERHQRACRLLSMTSDLPADRRAAAIVEACHGDESLRDEALALLEFARSPLAALRTPGPAPSAAFDGSEWNPTHIGRFRLVRRLGEGGSGVVFEARQRSPRRAVALKVLRPGLVSSASTLRFEQEIRCLAQLDHPGIVRIYHAARARVGALVLPYFAMELVDGCRIDQLPAGGGWTLNRRIGLMAEVCDAVDHAHRHGVMHRDLKPANILVDKDGRPRILDFGVAKLFGDGHAACTIEGEIIGTVAYMAPELVAGQPIPAMNEPSADVYSIGACLFEVLTSRPPVPVDGLSLAAALRVVRETPVPRLASIDRRFKGDLDALVSKALAREPSERYLSAAELARDLRRVLGGQRTQTRRFSRWHVGAPRFLRRRSAAGIAVLAVMLLAGALFAWDRSRSREEQRARTAAIDLIAALSNESIDNINRYTPAARQSVLSRAARIQNLSFDHAEIEFKACAALGSALLTVDEADEAVVILERALRAARAAGLSGGSPAAVVRSELASALGSLGRYQDAEAMQREAIGRLRAGGVPDEASLVAALLRLALVERQTGRADDAIETSRRAVEIAETAVGAPAALPLWARVELAQSLFIGGRFDEALVCVEPLLLLPDGNERINVTLILALQVRGRIALLRNDIPCANASFDRALRVEQAVFAGLSPFAWQCQMFRGGADWVAGDLPAAEARFTQALTLIRASSSAQSSDLALATNSLGVCLRDMGRFAEAETLLRDTLAARLRATGEASWETAASRINLARLLLKRGRANEALALGEAALDVRRSRPRPHGAIDLAEAYAVVGEARELAIGPGQGRDELAKADDLRVRHGLEDHWQIRSRVPTALPGAGKPSSRVQ